MLQMGSFLQMSAENQCIQLKTPKGGLREKIVLKLTSKLKMVEIETGNHIDVKKWNKQFELWCSHLFINQNF